MDNVEKTNTPSFRLTTRSHWHTVAQRLGSTACLANHHTIPAPSRPTSAAGRSCREGYLKSIYCVCPTEISLIRTATAAMAEACPSLNPRSPTWAPPMQQPLLHEYIAYQRILGAFLASHTNLDRVAAFLLRSPRRAASLACGFQHCGARRPALLPHRQALEHGPLQRRRRVGHHWSYALNAALCSREAATRVGGRGSVAAAAAKRLEMQKEPMPSGREAK